MASLESESMAQYWVDAIRNNKDLIRKYVSNPALFDRLASLEGSLKVLDSGCGEGYVSRELARRGHEVVGIDASRYIIKSAKEATVGNDEYVRADVFQMPFRHESFDCAVSNFLLVELEVPENFIKEVQRVLKPNGRFIFQTLHPSLFISKTGQSEGRTVPDYFKSTKISEKIGRPYNLESPIEITTYHHSLSRYTHALTDNGFHIIYLDEPKPIEETPPDDPIREKLKDPRAIIIDSIKT
jgi:ubiquinone/menaquinone biosynthesis C-methylase UbiE